MVHIEATKLNSNINNNKFLLSEIFMNLFIFLPVRRRPRQNLYFCLGTNWENFRHKLCGNSSPFSTGFVHLHNLTSAPLAGFVYGIGTCLVFRFSYFVFCILYFPPWLACCRSINCSIMGSAGFTFAHKFLLGLCWKFYEFSDSGKHEELRRVDGVTFPAPISHALACLASVDPISLT